MSQPTSKDYLSEEDHIVAAIEHYRSAFELEWQARSDEDDSANKQLRCNQSLDRSATASSSIDLFNSSTFCGALAQTKPYGTIAPYQLEFGTITYDFIMKPDTSAFRKGVRNVDQNLAHLSETFPQYFKKNDLRILITSNRNSIGMHKEALLLPWDMPKILQFKVILVALKTRSQWEGFDPNKFQDINHYWLSLEKEIGK
ncbi:hypothetical protein [Pseudobacteriovorax antillogorgiicola]|uniref:hypothetical protein n=1 Tax=Pseudobacteriovorax antillogorgiicola TaxID=1513793 RepID=UPI0013564B0B|nr:hypothetical protein [Pseudobacteriovorax antillogorgiicola]